MTIIKTDFAHTVQRLLTKEEAEKIGHIAWIECDNAEEALAKMAAAVEKDPCNCAIWANAGEYAAPQLLDAVKKMHDNFRSLSFPPGSETLADAVFVKKKLQKIFERAAHGDEALLASPEKRRHHKAALKELYKHASAQTSLLMRLFDPTHLRIRLQSGPLRTRNDAAAHVDGNPDGAKYRILQAFESLTTCLLDNDTFRKARAGTLTSEDTVTYWQAPANSLILFTNEGHPHLPILHAEPPWPNDPAKPPPHRTLAVYDLVYKPK